MAEPSWLTNTQRIVGQNHPLYADTKNAAGLIIQAMLEIEHEEGGRHLAQDYALAGESYIYVGDGNPTQTVTLQNPNLQPKVVITWYDGANWTYEKIDSIPGDDAFFRGSTATVLGFASITPSKGQFVTSLTTAATTFYYIALGIDTDSTYTGTPAAGSDPTWIISSNLNRLIGDGTDSPGVGNIANNVEIAMWTAFTAAHNDDGTHATNPYADYAKIDTGMYAGDGSGAKTIYLNDDTLDVKYVGLLLEIPATSTTFNSKSESMVADEAKIEAVGAFADTLFSSVGTGQFDVLTALNTSGRYYYWYVIGA